MNEKPYNGTPPREVTPDGFKVYCEVTDAAGKSVKSNIATVTMNTLKITELM